MSHPDGQRARVEPAEGPHDRPWEDGTANPPPDRPEPDYVADGWQAYPDTQPYPDSQPYQQAQPYPQAQPYQDQPTQQYGYPQQYSPQQQYPAQQPNPTQVFPAYDPRQHQAPPEYGEYQAPPEPKGPRRWMFALVALAALAVVVLAGILVLTNQRSDTEDVAVRPPTSLAPIPTLPPSQAPLAPPSAPGGLVPGGIPEILGNSGAAIGNITAIDGPTLTIQGIDGAPVTVLVTPQTQVLSLSGFDASSLKVGSLVVVNGSPMENGAITADIIVETPDLGG
ncbi:DUF5666 domain-containing protein [Rhodococcoides fascians]|uniref:DUF5666 domain-containing protein n=1 Tax=Rhodococcoides fascians TaxID=1828 RepID=UPI001E40FFD4|nr:DUF5666 domain-containing protein [Rhodococcus fascians]